jgi:hypothetical protein
LQGSRISLGVSTNGYFEQPVVFEDLHEVFPVLNPLKGHENRLYVVGLVNRVVSLYSELFQSNIHIFDFLQQPKLTSNSLLSVCICKQNTRCQLGDQTVHIHMVCRQIAHFQCVFDLDHVKLDFLL